MYHIFDHMKFRHGRVSEASEARHHLCDHIMKFRHGRVSEASEARHHLCDHKLEAGLVNSVSRIMRFRQPAWRIPSAGLVNILKAA